ncbi:MAG: hypothetical protein IBX57_00640 [Gammaproteobacteria bacterium]|nr:hypothetical protein [Gammaproteobacteria bacterium]
MSIMYNKANPYNVIVMVTCLLMVTGVAITLVVTALPDDIRNSFETSEEGGVKVSGYYIPNERLEETSTLVASCIMNIPKETKYFNLGVKLCMDEAKELYGLPLSEKTKEGEK